MNKDNKYFYEVEVDAFIEKIELSKKKRAQYYKGKTKLPKKYQNDNYIFDKNGVLIEQSTGIKVIKNIKTVGKPNIKTITGQYFWTGAHPHIRRKIKREMSDYFLKYMGDAPQVDISQYPLGVRIDLYDTIKGQDLDNFISIYRKVIHDVLTAKDMNHKPIIIDDSKEYIQDIPTKFYPIEDHEDRKLVIQIYSI